MTGQRPVKRPAVLAYMLGPRHLEFIIPGPQAHWAKIAFEKYFMATRKRGRV